MHYRYVWLRSGTYPGDMYVIPRDALDSAIERLVLMHEADPMLRWRVLSSLQDASDMVERAKSNGIGGWAHTAAWSAKRSNQGDFSDRFEASRWLWDAPAQVPVSS